VRGSNKQKLFAMATSLEVSEKQLQIFHLQSSSTIPANFVKIGPAGVDILCATQIVKNVMKNKAAAFDKAT